MWTFNATNHFSNITMSNIFVIVLGFSRETEPIGDERKQASVRARGEMRLIIGIGLLSFGGQEVP